MDLKYKDFLNTETIRWSVLCLLVILHGVLAKDLTKEGEYHRTHLGLPDHQTWLVTNNDANARLYSELIDVLERMNILKLNNNLVPCLKLERITRDVNSTLPQSTLGVHLYFNEKPEYRNAQIGYRFSNIDDVTHIVTSGCSTGSRLSAIGLDALDRKQTNYSYGDGVDKNKTGVVSAPQSNGKTKSYGGLSRTQVVVIATCSAVIGTFFLIAGIMRLTSFVKRYRANREQALNIARRASSIGLNGSNMSSGNLRRDSSASKASRQSNTALESGSDLPVDHHEQAPTPTSSHNSSPMHNTEHKPLLPVKSLSHNSNDGSSHDSLAYIDEESQSRIKGDDSASDSEMESEDDPLLRKSPDSGSSIDVPVPMIFQNANEALTSRKNNDLITDKDNGATVDMEPTQTMSTTMSPSNEINTNDDTNDVIQDVQNDGHHDENSSSNDRNGSSNDVNMDEDGNAENTPNHEKSNLSDFNGLGSDSSVCHTNLVGEIMDSLDNERNLSEMNAVTVGLTQSDGSISENRNYFYGNQTEYVLDNYQDYVTYNGYSCHYRYNHYNNYNIVNSDENSCQQNDLRLNDEIANGQCLNVSDNFNQPGSNGVSPSELSMKSLSISKDSSGDPLLSSSQNSYSPPNGSGYIPSGTDNLALVDSGEDDTETGSGSAQPTVVSHVVSLAEYHKFSPTYSKSMDQS